jgi:ribosomal protein S19
MARSLKKGPFVDAHLIKKVETFLASVPQRSQFNYLCAKINR